jgi:hypothetical protein
MSRRRIEILTFVGCPHREGARELVASVLERTGVAGDVELIDVPDPGAAEQLRFLGSPTIRVDGRDIEPGAEARRDYALACRVYSTRLGFRGQPDESWLIEALA